MSEELQAKINEITSRYQPEIDRIQAEGAALGEDAENPGTVGAVIKIDFDMEWKEREIVFDLPSVTMRDRNLSLDLPKIEMKRQRIVFDTPSVRMENRVVGRYPEFRGLRIRWRDIIMKVPVPFMERQEIIFDIPEVRMERKNLTLKIPEFGKDRQRWLVKLPEFTLKNVTVETEKLRERGQELQRRGEDLAERMEAEIEMLVASFYGPLAEEGAELRRDVSESFGSAIEQVSTAIDGLVARKIDPVKVPTDDGNINLRKALADLIAERDAVAEEIEESLSGQVDEAPVPELAENA